MTSSRGCPSRRPGRVRDGNEPGARQQFRRLRLDVPALVALEKRNRLCRRPRRLGSRRRAGELVEKHQLVQSDDLRHGIRHRAKPRGWNLKLHGAEDDSDAETPFPSETRASNLRRRRRRRRRVALGAFGPLGAFAGNVTSARASVAWRRGAVVPSPLPSRLAVRRSASLRNRSFSASRSKDRVKRGAHAAATSRWTVGVSYPSSEVDPPFRRAPPVHPGASPRRLRLRTRRWGYDS